MNPSADYSISTFIKAIEATAFVQEIYEQPDHSDEERLIIHRYKRMLEKQVYLRHVEWCRTHNENIMTIGPSYHLYGRARV